MPTNANAAQLVQAGAPSLSKATAEALCKAFARAVAAFCAQKPGERGQFNEHMMREVQAPDVNLWRRMNFEVPAAVTAAGPQFLSTVAAGGGAAGKAARGILAASRKLTHVTSRGWRLILGGMINRKLGVSALFPDATIRAGSPPRNVPVEVKGPGDSENPPGQFDKYKKMDPKGELAEVSCQTCPGSCGPGPTGSCP